jgi:hypothetical protein
VAAIYLGETLPFPSSAADPGVEFACANPLTKRATSIPPLLGLAPDGVCHASPVAGPAVGSYPTISPLPSPRLTEAAAVYFLWHFPSACTAWVLPSIPLCGVRTFLATVRSRDRPRLPEWYPAFYTAARPPGPPATYPLNIPPTRTPTLDRQVTLFDTCHRCVRGILPWSDPRRFRL